MMHTIRLLRVAKEIAEEGKLNVKRPDRDFLLNVKMGTYEYDDLLAQAEEMKEELNTLYENSTLPDQPDLDKVNELLVKVRSEFYSRDE